MKLNLKTIPREVFDKKAVADGAVKFSEVGYLDVRIEIKKLEVSLTLTDFSVFYKIHFNNIYKSIAKNHLPSNIQISNWT